jgi:hypothetical protein
MSRQEEKMSSIKEYRFFRSFSTKIENWSQRKAEAIWRKMREKKIAGDYGVEVGIARGVKLA